MTKSLVKHPTAGYLFLPGIAPYSSGVIATVGFEIIHVTLQKPAAWYDGLQALRAWLESRHLDRRSLCGVELRCPEPHTMGGFSEFNARYQRLLVEWDMLIDGHNPVARTNVAPMVRPPDETVLFGFSFADVSDVSHSTFVVAGGGELPHRDLDRKHIVRPGETSIDAMMDKAACVLRIMRHRIDRLEAVEAETTMVNIYTVHPVHPLLTELVVDELPEVARLGVHWHYTRPPVREIEFEMDLRGVRQELTIDLHKA